VFAVAQSRIGSCLEQESHDLDVALRGRQVQRRDLSGAATVATSPSSVAAKSLSSTVGESTSAAMT
jgi:hypothetical protein